MGIIFMGSTDIGSSQHTSRIIIPFLKWLKPDISAHSIHIAQAMLRKSGHVSEYAALAMLMWRCRRKMTGNDKEWIWTEAPRFIGAAAFYAATDEFHQYFVVTRQASVWDVLIDSMGAMAGLMFVWFVGKCAKYW